MNGDIAHIYSKPGGKGPRPHPDPNVTDAELNDHANLLVCCGVHHSQVDGRESTFTAEVLFEWKRRIEAQAAAELASEVVGNAEQQRVFKCPVEFFALDGVVTHIGALDKTVATESRRDGGVNYILKSEQKYWFVSDDGDPIELTLFNKGQVLHREQRVTLVIFRLAEGQNRLAGLLPHPHGEWISLINGEALREAMTNDAFGQYARSPVLWFAVSICFLCMIFADYAPLNYVAISCLAIGCLAAIGLTYIGGLLLAGTIYKFRTAVRLTRRPAGMVRT